MAKKGVLFETLDETPELRAAASVTRADWIRIAWQFVALCVVATGIAAISKDFSAKVESVTPEVTLNASTFNKRQTGYSGFLELCQRSHLKPEIWEMPYRDLTEKKGTLIVVAPIYTASSFELEEILKWVHKGNNLVYLDYFAFGSGRKFLQALDIDTADASINVRDQPMHLNANDRAEQLHDHVGDLVISANQRLTGVEAPLVSDDKGAFLTEIKYGDGRCLVGTVPTLASNLRFGEKSNWDNFQFLLNWLRSVADKDGKIWFDERAHGYSAATNLFIAITRGPIGLLLMQLFIVFLIVLVSLGQRFSAKVPVPVVRKISNLEYIEGLANTYQRAKAYDMAYSIVFAQLKNRLCRALSRSPEDDLQELAARWGEAIGEKSEVCATFLQSSQAATENRHLPQEQFSKLMKECDLLTAKSAELLGMRVAK